MKDSSAHPAMLAIAEQSGQIVPVYFGNEIAVSVAERNIHLQNVISHIAQANQAAGFLVVDDYQITWDLPHAPESMRRGNEGKLRGRTIAAKREFLSATGNLLLVDAGEWDQQEMRQESLDMYEHFKREHYIGPERYRDAMKYKRQLVAYNESLILGVSTYNRQQSHKPHETKSREAPHLTDRQRLTAVFEDPRAMFLPTTRSELTDYVAFLSYLDNPEYPLAINNQFLEVYRKTQKLMRNPDNSDLDVRRGPLSITYEIEDHLNDALYYHQALIAISSDILALPNGKVALGEEADWLNLDHPGFKALLRYRDINDYMLYGELPGRKDPLRTSTKSRWTKEGPGQHKFVEDRYTELNPEKAFGKYVHDSIRSMTVAEARRIITPAIEDHFRRANFGVILLRAIATPINTDSVALIRTLEPATSEATRSLQEHQLPEAA